VGILKLDIKRDDLDVMRPRKGEKLVVMRNLCNFRERENVFLGCANRSSQFSIARANCAHGGINQIVRVYRAPSAKVVSTNREKMGNARVQCLVSRESSCDIGWSLNSSASRKDQIKLFVL